eukprot:UN24461
MTFCFGFTAPHKTELQTCRLIFQCQLLKPHLKPNLRS